MRGINQRFIDDLNNGDLKEFLRIVKTNNHIDLEIRKNYINLYYMGGNALRITQKRVGYLFEFDSRYCLNKNDDKQYGYLSNIDKNSADSFIVAFPTILNEMRSYFAVKNKPERIFQHNLIKQNQKDLIVLDIEYAGWTSDKRLFRLDMLGLLVTKDGYKLIIFENKYGSASIGGNAGLKKHYDDIVSILSYPESKQEMIGSVINILNNKNQLGLLDLKLKEEDLVDIEILFVIAGFNHRSKSISNVVGNLTQSIPAKIIYMNIEDTKIDYTKAKDLFE